MNAFTVADNSDRGDPDPPIPCIEIEPEVSPVSIVQNSIGEHGVLHDAALFVARLRSNPQNSVECHK